jgi:argininosuccinate lyase
MAKRLWGEMFTDQPSAEVLAFMAGRDVQGLPPCDEVLLPYDLQGNIAHATMLTETGIIPEASGRSILKGLAQLAERCERGELTLDPALEDVHTNVERKLADLIGDEDAAHLHTARSRNDQVLCDMRLWERDVAAEIGSSARHVAETLLDLALEQRETAMSGYTHHQHATAATLGFVLAGFAPGFVRCAERASEWTARYNRCPLGAVTSYGTTFPICRERTAELLGFDGPEESALDSVHTRGEAECELVGLLELGVVHCSSLAASLIVLSTDEFGGLRIADAYSSGSSIMPQKRNPDALEVMKARAAAVGGAGQALRGLAGRSLFGYNREQQWTKYLVMDAVREGLPCFGVLAGVLTSMSVNPSRLRELATRGFLGATALVEALCQERALPFRIAKSLVSRAVALSSERGLAEVSHEALAVACGEMGLSIEVCAESVRDWQEPERALTRAAHLGGPAPAAVEETVRRLRERLARVG